MFLCTVSEAYHFCYDQFRSFFYMLRNTGQNIKGFLDGFCEAAARLPSPAVLLFCLDRAPKLDKNKFKKEREKDVRLGICMHLLILIHPQCEHIFFFFFLLRHLLCSRGRERAGPQLSSFTERVELVMSRAHLFSTRLPAHLCVGLQKKPPR